LKIRTEPLIFFIWLEQCEHSYKANSNKELHFDDANCTMANMNSVYISFCTVHIYNRHCICIALDKFSSIASTEQAAAIDDHGWAVAGGHGGETAAATGSHGGERAAASGSELLSRAAMAVSQLLPRRGDGGLGAAPDLRRWRSCGGGRPPASHR
jgi:hypothetical protein